MGTKPKKLYIIDTSVLIHNPEAILDFKKNIVILPIGVLEELDRLKKSNTETGYCARDASAVLEGVISTGKSDKRNKEIKMKDGGILRFDMEENHFNLLPSAMQRNKDNAILVIALRMKNEEVGRSITIVAKDINLRVKARALGLKVEDYKTDKVDTSGLHSGIKNITLKPKALTELVKTSLVKSNLIGQHLKDVYPNECFKIKNKGGNSFLTRYEKSSDSLVWINDQTFFKPFNNKGVKPCNDEQILGYSMMTDPGIDLISLFGPAGTGKTLLALLAATLELSMGRYERICIFRINKEIGEPMGFLPGTEEEKMLPWARPIITSLKLLYNRGVTKKKKDGFDRLMENGLVEISGINYIRGDTFSNSFVILDDAQNLTPNQMKAFLTRIGEGSKCVLTGDLEQIDDYRLDPQSSGLSKVLSAFPGQPKYAQLRLQKTERSELAALAARLL